MTQFFSPAKINLFLRILGKRADGYHDLASLMQAISFCDVLDIQQASQDSLTCTNPNLSCDASNLVLRAAALFREKSHIPLYINVHLDKRIPLEAGLGGGSSNAATVLWAMNQIAGSNFSDETLQEWSSLIGSDIPFFFATGTAFAQGRGEIVRRLPPLQMPGMWIVKPTQGLSTRAVFTALESSKLPARDPESALVAFQSNGREALLFNDLEGVALQLEPALKRLYSALQEQYGAKVLLSGSGSSFFCFGAHKPQLSLEFQSCLIQQAKAIWRDPHQWYRPL